VAEAGAGQADDSSILIDDFKNDFGKATAEEKKEEKKETAEKEKPKKEVTTGGAKPVPQVANTNKHAGPLSFTVQTGNINVNLVPQYLLDLLPKREPAAEPPKKK
jgi:hypothetical protein